MGTRRDREFVLAIVKRLGGYRIAAGVDAHTTHVIVKDTRYETLNYLYAVRA